MKGGSMDKADLLIQRFVHRFDGYALQWYDKERGSGYRPVRTGRCRHDPPCVKKYKCEHLKLVPLKQQDVIDHVLGEKTLGIYQLDDNDTVKWLCFDIDISKRKPDGVEGDELTQRVKNHTLALAKELVKFKGKNSFLVEDTGNKGYHIWVFFKEPVKAIDAATVGLWMSHLVDPPQGIHVEVFPKQSTLNALGNLVKMPLGIHLKTGRRCLFVNSDFVKLPNQWEALANVGQWAAADLTSIIEANKIEPPRRSVGGTVQPNDYFVCMQRIMDEGPQEGSRDAAIFRLGLWSKDKGIPQDVATAMGQAVNEKAQPPLDDEEVISKVESAYHSDYSPFPCSDQLINPYCSSTCKFWKGKVDEHWTRFGKKPADAIGVISRD